MSTNLTRVREQVGQRLQAVCAAEQQRASHLHPAYGQLWNAIQNQVNSGGKYLRPYIIVLTYEAYGGIENIVDVATAWELLHIGLLMHDDVIDNGFLRHGQPNIAGQYLTIYHNEYQAQSAGLLAGDAVIATARRLLTDQRLIDIFDDALFKVIGGELLDLEAGMVEKPAEPDCIAAAKTASYTTIGPLLTGATLAGVDSSEILQLTELGRILGMGFQLADDLLVFSNDEQAGKAVNSDLAEGKRTAVIAEALRQMPEIDRQRAEKLLQMADVNAVSELQTMINQTNTLNTLSDKLTDMSDHSLAIIDMLQINPDRRTDFFGLVDLLLKRKV